MARHWPGGSVVGYDVEFVKLGLGPLVLFGDFSVELRAAETGRTSPFSAPVPAHCSCVSPLITRVSFSRLSFVISGWTELRKARAGMILCRSLNSCVQESWRRLICLFQ